jgi:hypothetical protein
MNKRVKFRIWNTTAEGYAEEYRYNGQLSDIALDEDEIWQQFTGLIDKNGKEIYEGDIIKGLHDFGPAGFHERTMTIYFNNTEGGYGWNYWDKSTIEVIGNIYENSSSLLNEN